jgi:hypothetical protein
LLSDDNLYTFGSQDGGTLVTLTDDIRLKGIARVLLPVMPGLVRSAYRKNLTGLKAILEAQPPRPGGSSSATSDRRGTSAHPGPIVGNDHEERDVSPTGGGMGHLGERAERGIG